MTPQERAELVEKIRRERARRKNYKIKLGPTRPGGRGKSKKGGRKKQ